jgi:hypothetical protein
MRRLVKEGREPALLGHEEGVPAGWISIWPTAEYGRLLDERAGFRSAREAGPRLVVLRERG